MIKWTDEELAIIKQNGKVSLETAEAAMKRCKLNFSDVEAINHHYEEHRWGSEADRKYRKTAVNKAIKAVALNPMKWANGDQKELLPEFVNREVISGIAFDKAEFYTLNYFDVAQKKSGFTDGTFNYYQNDFGWNAILAEIGVALCNAPTIKAAQEKANSKEIKNKIANLKGTYKYTELIETFKAAVEAAEKEKEETA